MVNSLCVCVCGGGGLQTCLVALRAGNCQAGDDAGALPGPAGRANLGAGRTHALLGACPARPSMPEHARARQRGTKIDLEKGDSLLRLSKQHATRPGATPGPRPSNRACLGPPLLALLFCVGGPKKPVAFRTQKGLRRTHRPESVP